MKSTKSYSYAYYGPGNFDTYPSIKLTAIELDASGGGGGYGG